MMLSAQLSYENYLVCPVCREALQNGTSNGHGGKCRAVACPKGHKFPRVASVPNLLPPRYTSVLTALKKPGTRGSQVKIKVAKAWLSDALEIDLRSTRIASSEKPLRRFLIKLGTLVSQASELGLNELDLRELCTLLSSEAMSAGYRRYVADPAVASMEAVNYEKYEDILLRRVVADSIATGKDVALIELGSGPGRLLHQYGSVISTRDDACVTYRRLGPLLYSPESLPNRDKLTLLLGIDFADDMLRSADRWLRRDHLGDLVSSGRISQVCATVRDLPVSFDEATWGDTTRIACVLFQTLGNQIGHSLQLEMLKVARSLIGKRGVVFVSVFNAKSFEQQGERYYDSIRKSVGPPWHRSDREFLSKRGVYSKWFEARELRALFEEAGMAGASILSEDELTTMPDYESYIDSNSQAQCKQRALIGIYSRGLKLSVT